MDRTLEELRTMAEEVIDETEFWNDTYADAVRAKVGLKAKIDRIIQLATKEKNNED